MIQSTSFSGHPVFAQLAGLINKASFNHLVKEHDADRYCKRCNMETLYLYALLHHEQLYLTS